MQEAFGFNLDQYIFYGAYPGAASLIGEPSRWASYIRDSLIEPTISRDVLLLTRVDKPALLRRLFELGAAYSGQILSYNKMLGQLQDSGNTTTLAHYLDLLTAAGMLTGLQKYSAGTVRRRASSPKLQVLNTALMTAMAGLTLEDAKADREFWGRLVESAVGTHLVNASSGMEYLPSYGQALTYSSSDSSPGVYYWRDRNREVDFVLRTGRTLTAIEVKSGRSPNTFPGLAAFAKEFGPDRSLLVGEDGIPLQEFLSRSAGYWTN